MASRTCVILNPCAGSLRRRPQAIPLIHAAAKAAGASVVVTQNHQAGGAEALARESRGHFDHLIAVGGDGTLAEVVNGMDRTSQTLALLAAGTGNSLARDLALPLDLAEPWPFDPSTRSVRALDLLQVTFCDAAGTQRRLAVCTTGLGYVASVVALTRGRLGPMTSYLPTWLSYPLGASLQAFRQRPQDAMVQVNGGAWEPQSFTNLMVQNTVHAGNFRAFPTANPTDGHAEFLLARANTISQLAHNLAVLTRSYVYHTAQPISVRHVAVRLRQPTTLMLDGELWNGVDAVAWEIVPASVQFVGSPMGRTSGARPDGVTREIQGTF